MNTCASVNYHICCKYINMEIFIFKFPYIANYEIISVGLTVISFCFSFECRGVSSTHSTDKQSSHEQLSEGGGQQVPTGVICTSTLSGQYWSVRAVFVWKFARKWLSYGALTTVGGLSGTRAFLSLGNKIRKLYDLPLKTAFVPLTEPRCLPWQLNELFHFWRASNSQYKTYLWNSFRCFVILIRRRFKTFATLRWSVSRFW